MGAFDRPPGDPGALRAAAGQLQRAATDLNTQTGRTKSAVALSVHEWKAPRADDFRRAGAGLQVELGLATDAVGEVAKLLTNYAAALENAQHEIASLGKQSQAAQTAAQQREATMPADSPNLDLLWQHTSMRMGGLATQAGTVLSDLKTLAGKIAGEIDHYTSSIVPGSEKLSPGEIQRKVDAAFGVTGLTSHLTSDQAWSALKAAQAAVPADAVEEDGSVDWHEAFEEFNKKYLDPYLGGPVTGAAGLVAPSEGWALYHLMQNRAFIAQDAVELRTAFSEIVGPVAYKLDSGLASWTELNEALTRYKAGADAVSVFQESRATELVDAAKAGGLPERGVIGVLGKVGGVVGVASDVAVLIDPGVENKDEATGLRVTAGVNIAATGMAFAPSLAALVGVNAVADWIPGVGQVVMVATGLILAGDYIYHHREQIAHAAEATGHALATATTATTHFVGHEVSDAGHAVSSVFHHIF
jgi:hypothetical protein